MLRVLGCLLVIGACGEARTHPNAVENLSCPAVACGPGAVIKADLPLSFEELKSGRFELCVNDQCFENRFDVRALPPVDGIDLPFPGARSDAAAMRGHGDVFVSHKASGSYLELRWYPRLDAELQDGDHYRLTFTNSAGGAQDLIETNVDYALEVLKLGPSEPDACDLTCHRAELDLRSGP